MTTREEATDAFIADLEVVIAKHWGELAPWACEDDDEIAVDEDGFPNPYVGAWAMVLGVASLDRPRAGSFAVSYAPTGQLDFTTSGLMRAAANTWDL